MATMAEGLLEVKTGYMLGQNAVGRAKIRVHAGTKMIHEDYGPGCPFFIYLSQPKKN